MQLYVSGSLAYDRIMNFDGRFADHILPDKIHVLNVCFNVNGLTVKLGGTAGNIAYGLAQLGQKPVVLGCLGKDGDRYLRWLESLGIETDHVRVVDEEYTAGAFITTDRLDNQITGFNPGAMAHSCRFDPNICDPADALAIVAPNNLEEMLGLCRGFAAAGVPYIFDPGQSLNIWSGEKLLEAITGARLLISNDYELEMIIRMTGRDLAGLLELTPAVITTRAEHGSQLCQGRERVAIPAAPADRVVDPTGAGDAYRAGLMLGMARGESLPEACLMGAAIASFAVACHGTQEYSLLPGEFAARLAAARRHQGRPA